MDQFFKLTRQEFIDELHDHFEKKDQMYINHSILSDNQLKIAYFYLVFLEKMENVENIDEEEENKLKNFIDIHISENSSNDSKGWLCYIAKFNKEYLSHQIQDFIDTGVEEYNNPWCKFEWALHYCHNAEAIKLLEEILDIIPLACVYLAELYEKEGKERDKIIELYTKYLCYTKDGTIRNSKKLIPSNYLSQILNQISNILKIVISINPLINIIMQFY